MRWIRTTFKTSPHKSMLGEKPGRWLSTWHTYECLEAQRAHVRRAQEYKVRWPNYCRACDGWGGFATSYDPSPAGVGLSPGSIPDFDPCVECSETPDLLDSRCPRCGKRWLDFGPVDTDDPGEAVEAWFEAEAPCPSCSWNWGHSKNDGLPIGPDCACYLKKDYPRQWRGKGGCMT
jgi:hypothetical protein